VSPTIAQSSDTRIAQIITETIGSPTSSINQQVTGGVIQYNGSDYTSGFNNQNCNGGCAYVNIKNNSINRNVEVSVGGLWQFGSPEKDRQEVVRINNEPARKDAEIRQKRSEEESINFLRKELTEALTANNIPNAILIARQLAPKLKYLTHWQLLAELGWQKEDIDRALKSRRGENIQH
jgi:hypothetical protein